MRWRENRYGEGLRWIRDMYGADFILDDLDLVALNSCSTLLRVGSSTAAQQRHSTCTLDQRD
jgi:hypothetical protein